MHDWQSEVRVRLAPLRLKPEREADIVDEIAQHLAERYREAVSGGASAEEATRLALAEFRAGNVLAQRIAALKQAHAPQPLPVGTLGGRLVADLWLDLRLAARMLRRTPGFTIVAALTLALGIGINTTIFSGISGLLLKSLPYANAERLVDIQPPGGSASKASLVDAREQFDSFDSISGYSLWTFTLMAEQGAEQLLAVRATADLFEVLGAPPLLGRTLIPADGVPGAEPVIVLSYDFWQQRFGGDPGAVGRTLDVSYTGSLGPARIVGVMPREFAFPTADAEMWAPMSVNPADTDYNTGFLEVLGHLAPGVDVAAAEREFVGTVTARCAEQPNCDANAVRANSRVLPLRESLVGPVRPILLVLFGAVGFVLLIACANVASLLLTRAAVRERELAIRTALGAGRGRVARQLLTESLLVAAVGGVLGVLAAVWGASAFRAALPAGLVGVDDVGIDLRVLAFAGAAVVFAALLAGLFPALGAPRANLHAALLDRGAGGARRARRRTLGALVVAEFALALVLTVGAGLMIRSFENLSNENPGFSGDGVLSLRVATPPAFDAAANGRFWHELLDRVGALPGVKSVGAIHLLPLSVGNWAAPLLIDGRPLAAGEAQRVIAWRSVTPGYFETLRIPLVRGRLFTEREHEAEERLVLINETAAARYFPNEDPIGQQVRTVFEGEAWATVVGIVGDTKDQALASPAQPQLYRLRAPYIGSMTLMVRSDGDPLPLAAPIREIVRQIEDDAPVSAVQLLDRVAADSIAQPRLLTGLLFGFGAIALLLGAIGLYGVMAHGTVQRTREFGVRIALGASTSEVLGLVARDAIRLAVIGVGLGTAGAFALTRLLESQLYGVAPLDPFAFAGAAALLAAVALAAALLPALRAARTDPMEALRWE
jgi:predicted permease